MAGTLPETAIDKYLQLVVERRISDAEKEIEGLKAPEPEEPPPPPPTEERQKELIGIYHNCKNDKWGYVKLVNPKYKNRAKG